MNRDDRVNRLGECRDAALERPRVVTSSGQLPVAERLFSCFGETLVLGSAEADVNSPPPNSAAPNPLFGPRGEYPEHKAVLVAVLSGTLHVTDECCSQPRW